MTVSVKQTDYDMDVFLENLRDHVNEAMDIKGHSLNYYAANVLEMPPSTLSKFLSGDRAGHGFETLFFLRDKLLHDNTRVYSKVRLNRFHRNLTKRVQELYEKHGSYESVGRAVGLSKTAIMHMTKEDTKLPQTATILKILRYLNEGIDDLANQS